MLLIKGQIIVLKMRVNNCGTVLSPHPYIVIGINENDNTVEIAQIDSLKGKEYKAAKRSNKIIYADNPQETVIDEDSYVQLDNTLLVVYFDDLTQMRRQTDVLSLVKLTDLIDSYETYHKNNIIADTKQVYVDEQELRNMNQRLKRSD